MLDFSEIFFSEMNLYINNAKKLIDMSSSWIYQYNSEDLLKVIKLIKEENPNLPEWKLLRKVRNLARGVTGGPVWKEICPKCGDAVFEEDVHEDEWSDCDKY